MQCPSCHAPAETVVTDSRANPAGTAIRRRRECQTCHARFTTYETIRDEDPELRARQTRDLAVQLRELAQALETG
jgi:transcriptional regulator NrdR family protein